jgi:hypothetical protein
MAVEKAGEKYRCRVYGNEVIVTEAGGVCVTKKSTKAE